MPGKFLALNHISTGSFSLSVFYHSTDPTAYDNDLTILKMDVASICGGKKDKNPLNLWILIVLEVLLLVLILTKVTLALNQNIFQIENKNGCRMKCVE